MIRRALFILAAVAVIVASGPAFAKTPEYKGCEGPEELCKEVFNLREKVVELEELDQRRDEEAVQKDGELAEKDVQKDAEAARKVKDAEAAKQKEAEESATRSIVLAAIVAIALRQLLQSIKGWKGFFTSDKAKGWLKIVTLVIGFAAFVAAHIGMAMPWWQALILAGGGPGAMVVDSVIKMIPVLLGKKKYEEVSPASEAGETAKDPSESPDNPS